MCVYHGENGDTSDQTVQCEIHSNYHWDDQNIPVVCLNSPQIQREYGCK